jgi:hypothetical protein
MLAFGCGVAFRLVDMESRLVLLALFLFGLATGDVVYRTIVTPEL